MGPAPILFFCLLYSLNQILSWALTINEEKSFDLLKNLEIFNPTDNEKKLAGMVIQEREYTLIEREKLGSFKTEAQNAMMHKKINVVRSRVEYLEHRVFPKGVTNPRSRRDRWVIICNSPHSEAQQIRAHVLLAYGSADPQKSIMAFANALQRIYGDLSAGNEYAPHNQVDDEVLSTLRNDAVEAKKLLSALGIHTDFDNVKALRVISHPLLVLTTDLDSTDYPFENLDKTFRRIKIYPAISGCNLKSIKKEDVKSFFTLINLPENFIIEESAITIDFDDYTSAVNALNNHKGSYLKNIKVYLQLDPVNTNDAVV